jgi:hypothetical protein
VSAHAAAYQVTHHAPPIRPELLDPESWPRQRQLRLRRWTAFGKLSPPRLTLLIPKCHKSLWYNLG